MVGGSSERGILFFFLIKKGISVAYKKKNNDNWEQRVETIIIELP